MHWTFGSPRVTRDPGCLEFRVSNDVDLIIKVGKDVFSRIRYSCLASGREVFTNKNFCVLIWLFKR